MKIVYITMNDIFGATKNGGTQCSKRYYDLLQKIVGEENVYACVIAPNKGYTIKNNDHSRCFCQSRSIKSVFKYALQGRIYFTQRREREICEYIDSLQCDRVVFGDTRLGILAEHINKDIKKVVFVQNIEKNYIIHMAKSNPAFLILYPAFFNNERKAIAAAHRIICLNQRDANLMENIYGRKADFILPITFEDMLQTIPSDANSYERIRIENILFVGSLFHSNLEGLSWFVKNVMPHVKSKLTIVGRGFETKKELLQRDNVDVVGTVDCLEDYYNKADAIVSPILSGDGMKVKTAEAMMYGKNIFATKEALEGYVVSDVSGIVECNSSQEFINALNTAYDEPTAPRFNLEVRNRFCDKYQTESYYTKLKAILVD